jgi:hypothetical protein
MNAVPVKHYDVYWSGPYEYDPDNDVLLPEIHAKERLNKSTDDAPETLSLKGI